MAGSMDRGTLFGIAYVRDQMAKLRASQADQNTSCPFTVTAVVPVGMGMKMSFWKVSLREPVVFLSPGCWRVTGMTCPLGRAVTVIVPGWVSSSNRRKLLIGAGAGKWTVCVSPACASA